MKTEFHSEFYSFAKYYDIAFDFKNVKSECDFFEYVLKESAVDVNLKNFVEFAAGPALHTIEMAKRGWQSVAVDLSSDMQTYGSKKAKDEGVQIEYFCADMVNFRCHQKFSLATILMDSTSYLLTNDDFITHLRSVADILVEGGIYILEMSHPKNIFNIAKTTTNEWISERDGCKVQLKWGSDSDVFDPITQVTQTSVVLEYDDHGKKGVLSDRSPQRCFTSTEFEGLVRASGVFEIANMYGAMNSSVPFNNDKSAWRMIPILKRK